MTSESPPAAAASTTSATLLTIHVCRGKFMVWQPEVCRALALEWRIVGDFGALRPRQQSWGGACSGALPEPAAAGADGSADDFSVLSLPMYLMPAQVLFLLHHAPTAKLLRIVDASSIAALRQSTVAAAASDAAQAAAVPAEASSSLVAASAAERVAAFRETISSFARSVAQKRKQRGAGSPAPDGAAAAEPEDAQGDAKRRKLDGTAQLSDSPAVVDEEPADPASSLLPAGSSYRLAMDTLPAPPDAAATMRTGHPSASVLSLHYPLESSVLISNRIGQLELRNKLTNVRASNAGADWSAMQRLVYAAACESIGMRLHAVDCTTVPAPSPRSLLVPFSASSASVQSLLSQTSVFAALWSRGYVVLPGAHFSAELVAYEDLPSRLHSSFLVKILADDGATDEGEGGADGNSGSFTMEWMTGLGRIASNINKAVLLVRPQLPPASKAVDAAASSSTACACVSHFGTLLQRHLRAQLQFTTFHWNPTASLANASFSQAHLRTAPLELLA